MEKGHVRMVPVFRPTWDEFRDFSAYMTSIEKEVMPYGLCKVIPPKGWVARSAGYDSVLATIKVENPVQQEFYGRNGVYVQVNVQKRSMGLEKFMSITEEPQHRPPKPSRGGAARNRDKAEEGKADEPKLSQEEYFSFMERKFWQGLLSRKPTYGADISCSLTDASVEAWNLSKLHTILDKLPMTIPGVNSPYLYFGMWGATFSWHVEDKDLYSINYLHFGAPKSWYGISPHHRGQFEQLARTHFSSMARECREFLRHKMSLIAPQIIEGASIPLVRAVQEPGEFIVTLAGAYHAGFNYGFNCAEAVNFALEPWIPMGCAAGHCQCIKDAVRIDMSVFLSPEARAALEAAEAAAGAAAAASGGDANVPPVPTVTVPTSMGKSMARSMMAPPSLLVKPKRRRKNSTVNNEAQGEAVAVQGEASSGDGAMALDVKGENGGQGELVKTAAAEAQQENPWAGRVLPTDALMYPNVPSGCCAVCLKEVVDGEARATCQDCMMLVHQACHEFARPLPSADATFQCARCALKLPLVVPCAACPRFGGPLVPTDDGRWCHIVCAQVLPEVSFADDEVNTFGVGFASIPAARFKLRCLHCGRATWPCVQCSFDKCPKSMHVTCALEDRRSALLVKAPESSDYGISMGVRCFLHDQAAQDLALAQRQEHLAQQIERVRQATHHWFPLGPWYYPITVEMLSGGMSGVMVTFLCDNSIRKLSPHQVTQIVTVPPADHLIFKQPAVADEPGQTEKESDREASPTKRARTQVDYTALDKMGRASSSSSR